MPIKIRRALISVFDKTGIAGLASFLSSNGVEIISSGGTAKLLSQKGIKVEQVSDFTGFPEMMGGRVKTLHPKIHGAILCDRSKEQLKEAQKNGIKLIDLVVANLYPFEEKIMNDAPLKEAIENIDIGGPTLVRSAGKNYENVAVVVNPSSYGQVIEELKSSDFTLSRKTRESLALEAFEHVGRYDVVIANYLRKAFSKQDEFPDSLSISFKKLQGLRYGENPHQKAALYADNHFKGTSVLFGKQLQGKQLSYNNILDSSASFELVKEFDEPTAVIVKHNNPSGVASSGSIIEAYKLARSVDPEAAFGGVVALNREVDEKLAQVIIGFFVEAVIAPKFSDRAKEVFSGRKNLRLIEVPDMEKKRSPYREYRSVAGGLLVQDADIKLFNDGGVKSLKAVTRRQPTEQELKGLVYAWKIAKYVKSNAVIYARENRAVGIGAGQMKRVDAAKLGAMIANDYYGKESLRGCVLASDAFFPFRDGIDYAASLGVTAIIQPGGSLRDNEVIAAADEHNLAMVFTGIRHFRH